MGVVLMGVEGRVELGVGWFCMEFIFGCSTYIRRL